MQRRALCAAVVISVALGACARRPQPSQTETQASAAQPPPVEPSTAPVGHGGSAPAPAPAQPESAVTAAGSPSSGGASSDGGELATSRIGAWKTEVEGCLTRPREQQAALRSSATRAPEAVDVSGDQAYVRVEHRLSHACCLTSQTTVDRDAGTLRLRERLTGEPCRCRCDSTIRTLIAREPADRELVVELDENGARREVHRAPLPAPAPPRLPKKVQVAPPAASGPR